MSFAVQQGPYGSPGYWLHHAALVWRRVCEASLGDVTYPQFNILSAISLLTADSYVPTQQQVADFARMDRMMASKLVRTLEKRALLTRASDPGDARRHRLALTPAGREALMRCVAAARRADEEVFGSGPRVNRLKEDLRMLVEQEGLSAGADSE